jgi:hypothetical protein
MLLGSIAFAAKAQAAPVTTDVPFNGAITGTCTFGTPTAGVLAQTGTFQAVEGSGGMSGGFATGTAGSVTVNCSGGGSLTTAVPAQVSVPAGFTPAVQQSVVELVGSNTFTSANSGGSFDTGTWAKPTTPITLPTGTSNLNVAMVAGTRTNGNPLSGNYSYKVTLTATPN